MRGRRWVVAAVLATVVATLAGCGVPSESDIVVQGRGRPAGQLSGVDDVGKPPGQPDTDDPVQFVKNFLAAAAGSPDQALIRARRFLPQETRDAWRPAKGIDVVRLVGEPVKTDLGGDKGWKVEVTVRHVGELVDNGIVEAPRAGSSTYAFTVNFVPRDTGDPVQRGLFVVNEDLPPTLMLTDKALEDFYEQRTLYFWSRDSGSRDGGRLVPDLRYLRRDMPVAERHTEIVRWLADGPSRWLEPAVQRFDAQVVNNVPDTGRTLQVRLSRSSGGVTPRLLDDLATQLRWSLRREPDRDLDLGIDQARKPYAGNDYLSANAASRGSAHPVQFCVYQGKVYQLNPSPDETPPPAPGLATKANVGVRTAALHREPDPDPNKPGRLYAAFVRTSGLVVGEGPDGILPGMNPVNVDGRILTPPVWVPGTGGTGLIVADGVVKQFRARSPVAETVSGVPVGVTALAVPPDGRRLAYIYRDRLYVAALVSDGGTVSADPDGRRRVPTELTNLAGVAWSQQTSLAVAGRSPEGTTTIKNLTIDGAITQDPLTTSLGKAKVTHLVAFTDDPADNATDSQIMYVANGTAYNLFPDPVKVRTERVVGRPPGARDTTIGAPFFLD